MILVTGGTGLVGAHLLYHLIKDNETIRAIYRSEERIEVVKKIFSYYTDDASLISKIEWFKADITDIPAMIPAFVGVEKVYHCAAFISFNPKDYKEMRKVNIHGTAIIVNLSIDAKIKKLCFVGSIAAVGDALNGQLITEENEWNKELDNSGYSITKFGAEMEVWRASQEEVEVVIVNPGIILGSGFWTSGSGKLFSQVYKGFKYYTEGITGFVGVKDVVKSMILLSFASSSEFCFPESSASSNIDNFACQCSRESQILLTLAIYQICDFGCSQVFSGQRKSLMLLSLASFNIYILSCQGKQNHIMVYIGKLPNW